MEEGSRCIENGNLDTTAAVIARGNLPSLEVELAGRLLDRVVGAITGATKGAVRFGDDGCNVPGDVTIGGPETETTSNQCTSDPRR